MHIYCTQCSVLWHCRAHLQMGNIGPQVGHRDLPDILYAYSAAQNKASTHLGKGYSLGRQTYYISAHLLHPLALCYGTVGHICKWEICQPQVGHRDVTDVLYAYSTAQSKASTHLSKGYSLGKQTYYISAHLLHPTLCAMALSGTFANGKYASLQLASGNWSDVLYAYSTAQSKASTHLQRLQPG